MSTLGRGIATLAAQRTKILLLISLVVCLSAKSQQSSSEVRIPDYMVDEMRDLEAQEKSLKDTADGLGSIYDEKTRKEELEKIYKQKKELTEKIKDYQENEFRRIQAHRKFQDQFKTSTSVAASALKLNTVYKNVRLSQRGEVFPELTIIKSDGHTRTIKVLTSTGGNEFLQSTATMFYFAK